MLKNKLNLLFLLPVLFVSTVYSMDSETEQQVDKNQKIELVSKDKKKFKIKWKIAEHQSGLLKDMLEEHDDEDDDAPSIPLPNITSDRLEDIIELMERGYEYKDRKKEEQKEKLVEFIQEGIKRNFSGACKYQNILMESMAGANYLNASLILRSLGHVISQYKVTKDILKKYPKDLFWIIQAEYILRFKKNPLTMFEDKIIKDMQKQKLYDEAVKTIIQDNKMFVPEYKMKKGLFNKEKIECGNLVEISQYIEGFDDAFNSIVFISDCGKLVSLDVNNSAECEVKDLWSGRRDFNRSLAVFGLCGRYASIASFMDGEPCQFKGMPAVVINKQFDLWDIETCKNLKESFSKIKRAWFEKLAFCNEYLALGYRCFNMYYDGSKDRVIRIWNLKTRKLLRSICIKDEICHLACSSNGKYVAAVLGHEYYKKVKIWNIKTGRCERELECWGPKLIVFSPCEKYFALLIEEGVEIYNLEKGEIEKEISFKDNRYESLSFSPCGKYIVLVGREVSVIDVKKQCCQHLKTDRMPKDLTVAFSPCGKYFALVHACETENTTIINCSIWHMESKECKKVLAPFKISNCGMPLKGSIALRKFI